MDHARIEAELDEFCKYLSENESKLKAFVDIGATFDEWIRLELAHFLHEHLNRMGVPDNHVLWLERLLPVPGERRRLECDISVAPPPRRRRHDRAGLWLNTRTIWINLNYDQQADTCARDIKRLAGAGQDFAYFMVTLIRTTGKKSDYKDHLKDLAARIDTLSPGTAIKASYESETFRLSHGDTANIGVYFWRLAEPPPSRAARAANLAL